MSGQSATLSLKEAKAMQDRVQAPGSQAKGCGSKSTNLESHRKKSNKKQNSDMHNE